MTEYSKDELLSALLDGELDDDAHIELEQLLRERPEAQARLESFASIDNVLRQSFGEINDTPLPTIETDRLTPDVSSRTRSVSMPLAAAASVIMLLGGALFGMVLERVTEPSGQTLAQTGSSPTFMTNASSNELSNALETFASGTTAKLTLTGSTEDSSLTIIRTWKLEDGRYCREYDIASSVEAEREVGVACREHSGQWRIRMRTYPDAKGTFL